MVRPQHGEESVESGALGHAETREAPDLGVWARLSAGWERGTERQQEDQTVSKVRRPETRGEP
jgi:hypothetical protein